MIVDISQEEIREHWAYAHRAAEFGETEPLRIAPGIYLGWDLNFEIPDLIRLRYPYSPWVSVRESGWPHVPGTDEHVRAVVAALNEEGRPDDYGVCDSWEQILERWPRLRSDSLPVIIGITPVHRANQPGSGGWRWHKHGRYIGIQDPQAEYLVDERDIDLVYGFSLYGVRV